MYNIIDRLEAKGWRVSTGRATNNDGYIIAEKDGKRITIDYIKPADQFRVKSNSKEVWVNADMYIPEDLDPAIEEVIS